MEVKIDVSGEMDPQKDNEKTQFNLSNFTNLTKKIPSIPELFKQLRSNLRPTTEFLNTQNFKTVASVQRLSGRVVRNLGYFQSNYLCIFIILMIYCLVTSPIILLVMCGVGYACHKIRQAQTELQLFGKQVNTYQQCLIVNCAAVPVLYLVGAGAVMFWVLGASLFIISLHAAFYNIEAIVTEDTEGFLSEVV